MGAIGIICPGGMGDILLSTGVLKYRDILWPNKDVVWFCTDNYRYAVSRVPGIKEIKSVNFTGGNWTWWLDGSIEKGILTAPWMANSNGPTYPYPPDSAISIRHKLICEFETGVKLPDAWHPCLECSKEDEDVADTIMDMLPKRKTVMLETVGFSNQSFLTQEMIPRILEAIRREWGECNFVFASGGPSDASWPIPRAPAGLAMLKAGPPKGDGVYSCSKLALWGVLALYNRMDAFIGICSGLTYVGCSWKANPAVPRLEMICTPTASSVHATRGPLTTALSEKDLFEKLPLFLKGQYDFVPRPICDPPRRLP